MSEFSTTIAAISTAFKESAVGMVRISGSDALEIAEKVFVSKSGKSVTDLDGYSALFGSVFDAKGTFDTAIALVFRAPKSYTGENVVEITVHGGLYVTKRLLDAVISAGARLATAGEFTKRAYLNGKINLSQAEAVSAIISAKGFEEAKAALSASEGRLYKQSEQIKEKIITLLGQISAYCDYPDEDIVDVSRETLTDKLNEINAVLEEMLQNFNKGKVISGGIDTAIVGSPNVGKSTIMNLLSGFEKSIVTDIPGTTRDVVEDTVSVGEFTLRLCDTAGIRQTADTVESVGIQRAQKRLESASLIIAVFDNSRKLQNEDLSLIDTLRDKKVLAVINKDDLESEIDKNTILQSFERVVSISAKQNEGANALCGAICEALEEYKLSENAAVLINQRQYDCALNAQREIKAAIAQLESGQHADLIGINLEDALRSLNELMGQDATEEIVNEIFSKFCVGK